MAPLRREKRGADSDGNIIYYNYKPAESMSEKLESKESMESTIEMTSQESPNQLGYSGAGMKSRPSMARRVFPLAVCVCVCAHSAAKSSAAGN